MRARSWQVAQRPNYNTFSLNEAFLGPAECPRSAGILPALPEGILPHLCWREMIMPLPRRAPTGIMLTEGILPSKCRSETPATAAGTVALQAIVDEPKLD